MTWGEEGNGRMEGGGHDEEEANSRLECKNRYPIYYQNGGKMAIIDTLFITKMAAKWL